MPPIEVMSDVKHHDFVEVAKFFFKRMSGTPMR